uniref:Alpha-1-antiproteinase 2-like n=1 Tax=Pogona vitticeps TaxID=103695 RepID=A0A6J0VH69_9SAUR
MNSAVYLCLILLGLCTTIQGHHLEGHDDNTSANALKIYTYTAQFAVTLYKELSAASPGKNVFFSPLSISAIFSLLSLGAKSTTHTQILEGLSFNLSAIQEKEIHQSFHDIFSVLTRRDSQIQLDIGQALFLKEDKKPLQKFLDDIHGFYDAEILPTKFQEPAEAEKQINDYVEKKTHGKIVKLVNSLQEDTELVLVNYMFFKGNWKKPFDPQQTTERDFFVDQEKTVKVPMMHRMGWFYYYFDPELSCTVLQLDYNGTATAFFVLPERGKEKELEQSLSTCVLNKWAVHVSRHTANVYIPKFNISTSYDLKEPLIKLGIRDVFSDHADLTGFTGQPLKVTKVNHKAVLTVDEKGTEAAAATAVEAMPMSLPPTLEFNHPFMVLLYNTVTNSTLFIGKIVDPTEQ